MVDEFNKAIMLWCVVATQPQFRLGVLIHDSTSTVSSNDTTYTQTVLCSCLNALNAFQKKNGLRSTDMASIVNGT
jgi:hypothetical protein